jgi:hypothetical protein
MTDLHGRAAVFSLPHSLDRIAERIPQCWEGNDADDALAAVVLAAELLRLQHSAIESHKHAKTSRTIPVGGQSPEDTLLWRVLDATVGA